MAMACISLGKVHLDVTGVFLSAGSGCTLVAHGIHMKASSSHSIQLIKLVSKTITLWPSVKC
jgi:hypothetical protein